MILVADNLQVMNPRVADALERLDPEPLQDIARQCERAGAGMLDLNPGYLSRRREDRMTFMVEAVQEVSSLRLALDSPEARILARGLEACRETPVINGLSLDPRRLDEIPPLAAQSGADLVCLMMDERSMVPPRLEDRAALALELWEHCRRAGLETGRLIFDPLLPALAGPDAWSQTGRCIETVRLLAGGALFQEPVRTMAGLSNLRTGRRQQISIEEETTCLTLLAGAGLSLALADALRPEITGATRAVARFA